ncbi:PREDICTED: diacylglycerol kinase 7-like isoform X2 [Tarenaya hassleriana]|uniref:diacylglycerol kinase 7-like isoform X2 n=1 Tax=Tarenaya hassleriana TaxID=28532 RepID=UPI00053C1D71|nr:PREDICTED: diacylglycerol kinase 7-like isoform X2 [Tarenaya hassleriana]
MDSPRSIGEASTAKFVPGARPSTANDAEAAMRGCGLKSLTWVGVDREELRRRLAMPEYLRLAMRECIRRRDAAAIPDHLLLPGGASGDMAPEAPMVVFINPKSGGRHGPVLKERLQQLMTEEQVFDLTEVKPHEFVHYGLSCLDTLAVKGDDCAKECRVRIRVMVAGGDGTVGWVLGCIGELHKEGNTLSPPPPIGIIPLGTGNDLSRSFGWGGSFPFAWRSAVKRTLHRASMGPVAHLDSWKAVVSMPSGEVVDSPYSLRPTDENVLDQGLDNGGDVPPKAKSYEGVFYNYFSIGMDAQVAFGFHHLRNEKPYLAQGPISNKIIYSGYSCGQGWFCTPCVSDPGLRGLRNILKIHIQKVNCSEWEEIPVPKGSIVALNLYNYGSGRHPWGNLKPDYLEKACFCYAVSTFVSLKGTTFLSISSDFPHVVWKGLDLQRGFVEAHCDDGLLEIFGLKQGWHASFVMAELISAKHIAQAAAVRFELRGGEWKDAFLQMDGEPWKQPMNTDYSTFVEIKRVPFQSLMISGE